MQRAILAAAILTFITWGAAAASPSAPEPATPPPKGGSAPIAVSALVPSGTTGTAGFSRDGLCDLVEAAAEIHRLPITFFSRVLWQESSFRAKAVSPVGAQGIAQFMPATAAERGLVDPLDPRQAIPASAELLSDLLRRFGNLGLAAAAYNAGPRPVWEWIAGTGGMPEETRSYVETITGQAPRRCLPGKMH